MNEGVGKGYRHSERRERLNARARAPRRYTNENFVREIDEFDDELDFDEVENSMPKEAKDALHSVKPYFEPIVDEFLPPGVINISQEVGCRLNSSEAIKRIHHHFDQSDLGYVSKGETSFKLRVRPRSNPWFGTFSGKVHIYEDINPVGVASGVRMFKIEGLLKFRLSAIYVGFVALVFGILFYALETGFGLGFFFFLGASAIFLGLGYHLGRSERDDVEDRVAESFLRLRSTIHSLR